MSVRLEYKSNITTRETLSTNVVASNAPTITHNAFDTTLSLNAESDPAVIEMAAFEIATTGITQTINLQSLTGTNNLTVNLIGHAPIAVKFIADVDNAGFISIGEGASNGHGLLGSTFYIELYPGQEILFYACESSPMVSATTKNIDIEGTSGDLLKVMFVSGYGVSS